MQLSYMKLRSVRCNVLNAFKLSSSLILRKLDKCIDLFCFCLGLAPALRCTNNCVSNVVTFNLLLQSVSCTQVVGSSL